MATRRPKKMARQKQQSGNAEPGSNASTVASRLGPGMETLDLTFNLDCDGRGSSAVVDMDRSPRPWFIHWEVGVNASVNRGLRLAKAVQKGAAGEEDVERVVLAPRDGILTELLLPTGGMIGAPSLPLPAQDADKGVPNATKSSELDEISRGSAEQSPREKRKQAEDPPDQMVSGTAAIAETLAALSTRGSITQAEASLTAPQTRKSVVIGKLSFCGHPELHGTLCTSCGRNVVPRADSTQGGFNGTEGKEDGGVGDDSVEGRSAVRDGSMAKVTMKGGGTLTLSSTAVKKMGIDKSGRLLSSKRLALVLDLDNTLLHCSDHPDAGRLMVPGVVDGIHSLRLPNQPKEYYIKLRPGLRTFLEQAATMFEMTIYTAGTSQYADAVAQVLDPDRRLFQGRHFSTCYTPDLGRNTKSLERIFPCGLDMALIVDDRDDVWRGEQAKNLLLVRPYKYFVGQRSVPGGPTHDDDSKAPMKPPSNDRSTERSGPPVRSNNAPSTSSEIEGVRGSGSGDANDKSNSVGGDQSGESESSHAGDKKVCPETAVGTARDADDCDKLSPERDDVPERHVAADGDCAASSPAPTLSADQQAMNESAGQGNVAKLGSDTIGKLGQGLAALLAKQREQGQQHVGPTNDPDDINRDTQKSLTLSGRSLMNEAERREISKSKDRNNFTDLAQNTDDAAKTKVPSPATSSPDDTNDGNVEGGYIANDDDSSLTSQESKSSSSGLTANAQQEQTRDGGTKDVKEVEKGADRGDMSAPMSPPPPLATAGGAVENDPQLDCTLKTLEAVHGAFYAPENNHHGQPRDVARFLAKVRSRVLRGVRMVLSGVIPVSGAPADPRTHKLWRMAQAHGATVDAVIGRNTTHVVAVRLGTAKTSQGLRMPGVFVVHLDWLMNSVWHCRRERETLFLLAGQICGGPASPRPTMPTTPPPVPTAFHAHPEASPNSADTRGASVEKGGGREGGKAGLGMGWTNSGDSSSTASDEEEYGGDMSVRALKRRRKTGSDNGRVSRNGSSSRGIIAAAGAGESGSDRRTGGGNSGDSACGSSRSSSVGSEAGEWLNGMADELDSLL